jgi:hypothetical protein
VGSGRVGNRIDPSVLTHDQAQNTVSGSLSVDITHTTAQPDIDLDDCATVPVLLASSSNLSR